jgi:hypothetical protein
MQRRVVEALLQKKTGRKVEGRGPRLKYVSVATLAELASPLRNWPR